MGIELVDCTHEYSYKINDTFTHNNQLVPEFNGSVSTTYFAKHWEFPLAAVAVYCMMIIILPLLMKNREPIKPRKLIAIWNLGLAIFSWMGVYNVIPHVLLGPCGHMGEDSCGLLNGGLYKSMCTHATWYGHGNVGLWIALFVVSKIPELVDTFWLMIGKNKVILLHWYHHITVLLYCWHAYSVQTSIGIYFAGMNYGVHAIMYSYYAMTQWSLGTRKIVKPFAQAITFLQIAQMFGGIFVVCASAVFKNLLGYECSTRDDNTILAILMYTSYCLLFIQLYVERYCSKKKAKKA